MAHLFGTDNLMDDATLSIITGAANAQFPLNNMLIPITSKPFRSTGSSVDFLIDTGTITPIDTFMVVGDNTVGLGVDTISIYGSTTTDFSGSTEIVIDLSAENNFGFKEFTSVNFRYWKVELNGSVYCEISNIYLGASQTLSTNAIALGSFKYVVKENVNIKENKYGNRFITQYNTRKSLVGDFKLLNDTEYTVIREIFNDSKRSTPLWFITAPSDEIGTDSKYIYSGFFYLNKDTNFNNTNFKLWSTQLNLIEIT